MIGALAGAAAALGAFWTRCLKHPSPVIDPALVKVRSFAMANVSSMLFSAAFAAMLLGSVLFMTGVGVGFTLPTIAGASAASLPPARFATGSGIYSMARQLGFVLGVAIFVAVLGVVHPDDPLPAFDRGWTFMVIAGLLGVAGALAIGEVRRPVAVARPAAAQGS
jgi:hypothetical protein